MPDSDVPPAFSLLVQSYLSKRGLSASGFAKEVGTDPTYMSRFLAARRYPPEDLMPWAKALELTGEELKRFIEEGYLTRTHPYIAAMFERQRKEIEQLRSAQKPQG